MEGQAIRSGELTTTAIGVHEVGEAIQRTFWQQTREDRTLSAKKEMPRMRMMVHFLDMQ